MDFIDMDDDHYIANAKNAHIDTSAFQNKIRAEIRKNPEIEENVLVERIYDMAFLKTAIAPVDPDDDVLICRYLTPAKFIRFLGTREIAFPLATQFSDSRECAVPEDYENAVLRVFADLNRSGFTWADHIRSKASTWNISCWTELHNYFDDHLMWEAYAGGSEGIGITIRYGQLKSYLLNAVKVLAVDGRLQCGQVNYESISLLPFNKHNMFRNEKEIRFAFRSYNSKLALISVNEIFDLFGVRISPAAEHRHAETIRRMWISHGGKDRVQHPI